MKKRSVYFNHAATSYPKPKSVIRAINKYLTEIAVGPGRGGHTLSRKAGRTIQEAKKIIANFFGTDEINHFMYSMNVTYAINLTLYALLRPFDHIVFTAAEHNAVLRPLRHMEKSHLIKLTCIECDKNGDLNMDQLKLAIEKKPQLVFINHSSNVTGNIFPIQEITELCRKKGVKIAIDAAQTAGFLPLNVKKLKCDFLFFTGHKSLLGPPGIGGVYIRHPHQLKAFFAGGSGGASESIYQPLSLPEKFEPGTPNYLGLIGLAAGITYINRKGLVKLKQHKLKLLKYCLAELKKIDAVILYGKKNIKKSTPVISFNVKQLLPGQVIAKLDNYGIAARGGLQCAPLIHKALGTYPKGTIRVSFGEKNTLADVRYFIKALKEIIHKMGV